MTRTRLGSPDDAKAVKPVFQLNADIGRPAPSLRLLHDGQGAGAPRVGGPLDLDDAARHRRELATALRDAGQLLLDHLGERGDLLSAS